LDSGFGHVAVFELHDQAREHGDNDSEGDHVERDGYEDEGEGGAAVRLAAR
jgi:hypothetical protein